MQIEKTPLLWTGILIVAIICVVSLWVFLTAERFTLVVLYDEVGSLQRNAPVVWRGFQIGRVTQIRPLVDNQVGVTIRLDNEYAPHITRGTEFVLKPAIPLNLWGEVAIEAVTPESPGEPFISGEKIQGKRQSLRATAEMGKDWTLEKWQQLKELASRLVDELRTPEYRKQSKEMLNRLEQLIEESARQAKDKAEQFRREHADEIAAVRDKLEKLGKQLRESGEEDDARLIEEQLREME